MVGSVDQSGRRTGSPAHFVVGVLEGGGQHFADVGHVEQHERNAQQRVQHRCQFAVARFRRQVAVTCATKDEKEKEEDDDDGDGDGGDD